MTEDELNEKHSGIMKEIRWTLIGANSTFLLVTIADLPNQTNPWFPGWYGIFVILSVAIMVPVFWLLFSPVWKSRPISERLPLVFGFAALEWLLLLALGFKLAQTTASSLPQTMIPIFVLGVLLAVAYGLIQRRLRRTLESPESMFP